MGDTRISGNPGSVCTMVALLSLLHRNNMKKFASTGTVDIHGNIGAIDGVRTKSLIALRYGLQLVLPKENEEDYMKLDKEQKHLRVEPTYVSCINEADL